MIAFVLRQFFSIKFWSDELLNMFNKKHRHVWTRRGVHLDSTHEKEKCCILPKNMNLCVLLLLPTSFCATFILLTTTTNTSSLLLLSSPPSFVSLLILLLWSFYSSMLSQQTFSALTHKNLVHPFICSQNFDVLLLIQTGGNKRLAAANITKTNLESNCSLNCKVAAW